MLTVSIYELRYVRIVLLKVKIYELRCSLFISVFRPLLRAKEY